jgi:hypothetical protein
MGQRGRGQGEPRGFPVRGKQGTSGPRTNDYLSLLIRFDKHRG